MYYNCYVLCYPCFASGSLEPNQLQSRRHYDVHYCSQAQCLTTLHIYASANSITGQNTKLSQVIPRPAWKIFTEFNQLFTKSCTSHSLGVTLVISWLKELLSHTISLKGTTQKTYSSWVPFEISNGCGFLMHEENKVFG